MEQRTASTDPSLSVNAWLAQPAALPLELGVWDWSFFESWSLELGAFFVFALPMSWNVLITARTMNETGLRALQALRDAKANIIVPPKMGPLTEAELTRIPVRVACR